MPKKNSDILVCPNMITAIFRSWKVLRCWSPPNLSSFTIKTRFKISDFLTCVYIFSKTKKHIWLGGADRMKSKLTRSMSGCSIVFSLHYDWTVFCYMFKWIHIHCLSSCFFFNLCCKNVFSPTKYVWLMLL